MAYVNFLVAVELALVVSYSMSLFFENQLIQEKQQLSLHGSNAYINNNGFKDFTFNMLEMHSKATASQQLSSVLIIL